MTLTLHMMGVNARLSDWRNFDIDSRLPNYRAIKNTDKMAAAIVAQITHPEVVELIQQEWDRFPSDLRIQIASLCNERRDCPQSGNQAKFIEKLDHRLGGRLLRSQDMLPTLRDRRWIGGELVVSNRAINPAVAGAQRAALEQRKSGRKKTKKKR